MFLTKSCQMTSYAIQCCPHWQNKAQNLLHSDPRPLQASLMSMCTGRHGMV